MSVVIGIDVGGSTTKIIGFSGKDGRAELTEPMLVKASDPITSIYGAFGKFTSHNSLQISDIDRIMVTGVGGAFLGDSLYSCPCTHLREFDCIGRGGLYQSGLKEAIVVSMGTGTALIHAVSGGKITYLGGTGVGGGTIVGLSRLLLGMEDVSTISSLAQDGDLSKVDLRVGDLTRGSGDLGLPAHMTAANFGKVGDIVGKEDIALGVINMVFEVEAMLAVFSARQFGIRKIVLTGNLTGLEQSRGVFDELGRLFDVDFVIPPDAQYCTVVGAAIV